MNKDNKSIDDCQFSIFKPPITNAIPYDDLSLQRVYIGTKNGIVKDAIEAIRKESSKSKRNELKAAKLPCVTFAGTFSYRSKEGLIQPSGLIVVDLDHISDLVAVREKILSKIRPALLFISPSGDGLKVVYVINVDNGSHLQYFNALTKYFKVEIGTDIDNSGKDICRLCFLSYDPDVVYNDHPAVLDKAFIDTFGSENTLSKKTFTAGDSPREAYEKLKLETKKELSFTEGNRNNFVADLAGRCFRKGILEDTAFSFLIEYMQPDFGVEEIRKTVRSIYSKVDFKGVSLPETPVYYYFTFPLKFLWFDTEVIDQEKFRAKLVKVRDWATLKLIDSGKFDKGNPKELYPEVLRVLKYDGIEYEVAFENYQSMSMLIQRKDIFTSVKAEIINDTIKGRIPIDHFLMLAAVKSVIGMKRNFNITYRDVLVRRMYGGEPDRITRYMFDQIINAVCGRNFMTKIPAAKGIYVSIVYKVDMLKMKIIEKKQQYFDKINASKDAGQEIRDFIKKNHSNSKKK